MIVTLDVFSGRPNPTWKLNEKDAQQLLDRVANRAVTDAEVVDNVLGFRGFKIAGLSDDVIPDNLPANFRIGGALPSDYTPTDTGLANLSADETDDAVGWLLSTGRHVVGEAVQAHVADRIQMRQQGTDEDVAEPIAEADVSADIQEAMDAPACIIANTAYNPGFWNVPGTQPHNNCYNYAMNHRSNTFAQPGRISGHQYAGAPNCANVGTAANWDGCKTVCSGSNKLVALVIWPGVDYHWYRRHSNGFWGHKPGQTAARNTDNSNRVINGTTLTPQNCNRGPYSIFCGYRFSPTGMQVR